MGDFAWLYLLMAERGEYCLLPHRNDVEQEAGGDSRAALSLAQVRVVDCLLPTTGPDAGASAGSRTFLQEPMGGVHSSTGGG